MKIQINYFKIQYARITFLPSLVFVFLLYSFNSYSQSTYTGNVYFPTQADLDGRQGSYTSILGNVQISGEDITDLTPLQSIENIEGYLSISNNINLINLTGLHSITSIGGLNIENNELLLNLSGLDALTSIGEHCSINQNNSIINLAGLNALQSIGGYLGIGNNNSLVSLTDLYGLQSLVGFAIAGNNSLVNLSGLESVNSLSGFAYIYYNSSLTSLTGLGNLSNVQELNIEGNESLISLTGLESLTNVSGYYIEIGNNMALENLIGLSSLATIEGELLIYGNHSLTTLNGLSNITSIGLNLLIYENPNLYDCCALYNLINTPGSINGEITIENNQTGCDNQSEINTSCECPDTDFDNICDVLDNCIYYPNPYQEDSDCDGVGNACDLCPGGNDSIDINNDGLPDCHYLPEYDEVLSTWKCGNNKVYIAHGEGNGSCNTLCISYSAAQAHINHGDYLGTCGNSYCNQNFSSPGTHGQTNEGIYEYLELHPNPASDEPIIYLHGIENASKFIALDQYGRIVLEQSLNDIDHVLTFDLKSANLSNGIYYARVHYLNGILIKPFVIIN